MKELKLTRFNTIVGDNFDEMSVEKFLKIMNKKLGKNYNLKYTKSNNKFAVIFNGITYSLILDKIVIDNYALGNYNKFTYEVKRLSDKAEGKKTIDYEFIGAFIDDEESLQIIKDAKKGIFSDINSKKVFLEYLKESKKNVWGLKNFFNTLFDDIKVINNYYWKKVDSSNFLLFISGSIFLINFNWQVSIVILGLILGGYFVSNLYILLQKSISRFKSQKNINEIIKQLELEIQKDELKLENIKKNRYKQADKIEDPILKEICLLYIRIENISSVEKKRLCKDLIEIYKEYRERNIAIQNQDLDATFVLGEDNDIALKYDICGKISSIKLELDKIENVSGEIHEFNEQCTLLESVMGNSSLLIPQNKVIGGTRPSRTRKVKVEKK